MKGKDSYIITLSRYNGYSCYNCDRAELIVKNNNKIRPQTDFAQGLLLLNHSLAYVFFFFTLFVNYILS